jgi:hypothetical protein
MRPTEEGMTAMKQEPTMYITIRSIPSPPRPV